MFYHYCNYCMQGPANFNKLDELGKTLQKYKFPHALSDFETLGYKSYNCSKCHSSDRDRLYKLYLEKYIAHRELLKVVEFAPAEPSKKWLTSLQNVQYRSADLYMENVDDRVDITDMKKYKDNSFDLFVCSHVLEHVNDDEKAMKELYRILKPNGIGILMVPIITKKGAFAEDVDEDDISERWHRFGQDDHLRIYDRETFLERTRSAGFNIEQLDYKKLGIINLIRLGVRLKSKLYVVSKE